MRLELAMRNPGDDNFRNIATLTLFPPTFGISDENFCVSCLSNWFIRWFVWSCYNT